jgi:hypothetical protein
MSSSRDILTRQNPTITDVWDGKSYGNTGSHAGAYDAVLFNETYNATIQECGFDCFAQFSGLALVFIPPLSTVFIEDAIGTP